MASEEPVTAATEATNGDATQTEAQKAAKSRSGTAYPYFGLPTALRIVDAIRGAGGDEAANADVLTALQVTKNDRVWAYGVPAAIQFGLVERVGRGDIGRVRITELAKRIALPTNTEEKRVAKGEAFQQPELYQKLLERFAGHPLPQKEGLRNLLCREYQIVESMAAGAADAFLESLREAEMVSPQDTVLRSGSQASKQDKGNHQRADDDEDDGGGDEDEGEAKTKSVRVPADFIAHMFPLRRDLNVTIPLPATLTSKDVARLKKWMDTLTFDENDGDPT